MLLTTEPSLQPAVGRFLVHAFCHLVISGASWYCCLTGVHSSCGPVSLCPYPLKWKVKILLGDLSLVAGYAQKAVEFPGSLVKIVAGRLLSQLLHWSYALFAPSWSPPERRWRPHFYAQKWKHCWEISLSWQAMHRRLWSFLTPWYKRHWKDFGPSCSTDLMPCILS